MLEYVWRVPGKKKCMTDGSWTSRIELGCAWPPERSVKLSRQSRKASKRVARIVLPLVIKHLYLRAQEWARFARLVFLCRLRQAKVVDGDPCAIYN